MNARLNHRVAGQRSARKMRLHVNSLLGAASGSAHADERRSPPRGAYISARRDLSRRYSIHGEKFSSAIRGSHARATVRHPGLARKVRSLGAP